MSKESRHTKRIIGLIASFVFLAISNKAVFALPDFAFQKISAQAASTRALNNLRRDGASIILKNPLHTVTFSKDGVEFTQRHGSRWKWALQSVRVGGRELLASAENDNTNPQIKDWQTVVYERGLIEERYIAQESSVEQVFIINKPTSGASGSLSIVGHVESEGALMESDAFHARWSSASGDLSMSRLNVFDASGKKLSARFEISENETRLSLSAEAMKDAVFPITVDPEIGSGEVKISDVGPDGNANYGFNTGSSKSVVYNSVNNEYFVVWVADDDAGGLVDEEYEVYGQRIDAATGQEIGTNDFRISSMGTDGSASFRAQVATAAYNPTNNEYLVVWQADDNTAPLVDNENEIFGQRLNAATGAEIGDDDFRITHMGTDGLTSFKAEFPALAYNSSKNEYLVVWTGDDQVDNEFEVYGQRLDAATGALVGTSKFRISNMGPDGSTSYLAQNPNVAYNPQSNTYLVVWAGSDNSGALVSNEFEIYGQQIDGDTGALFGTHDFRISDMGPDGDTNYMAFFPFVIANDRANEFLVIWSGDDNTAPLVDGEIEIFGQRIDAASGAEVGTNDFRISFAGPNGNTSYLASQSRIAYSRISNEYLVVWAGTDDSGTLVANESEIFGQRLNGTTGAPIGESEFRISHAGTDGDASFAANSPILAWNSSNNQFLVRYLQNGNAAPLAATESELFIKRYIFAEADLSSAITSTSSSVLVGSSVNFEITVTNNSSTNAYGITSFVTLPTGITYQSASGTGWTCSRDQQVVACTIDSILSNSSFSYTVQGLIDAIATGSLDTSTVVSCAKSLDGTSTNDSATTRISVSIPTPTQTATATETPSPTLTATPTTEPSASPSLTISPDLQAKLQVKPLKNQTIKGSLRCLNDGDSDAGTFDVVVYLSMNKVLNKKKDTKIKRVHLSKLPAQTSSALISFSKKVPNDFQSGYVIGVCDSEKEVAESNELNNVKAAKVAS